MLNSCVKGEIEEPFQDPPVYTLYLTVHTPPSSGFLVYHSDSPRIVLDQYTGEDTEIEAPDWVNMIKTTCSFWQPRVYMLKIMATFAIHAVNDRISSKVLHWCDRNSVCFLLL